MISFKNNLPKIDYAATSLGSAPKQNTVIKKEKKDDLFMIGTFKVKKKLVIEIGIAYLIKILIAFPFVHGKLRKSLRAKSKIFDFICRQGEKVVLPIKNRFL